MSNLTETVVDYVMEASANSETIEARITGIIEAVAPERVMGLPRREQVRHIIMKTTLTSIRKMLLEDEPDGG